MTIEDLYELAQQGGINHHVMLDLETVSEVLAERVLLETGVDITGFIISMDVYGIRHALERHGNPNTEEKRGQIAIEAVHFAGFIEFVRQADFIRYDTRGQQGQPNLRETLVFQKSTDHQYVVALEIRRVTKRGKICRLVFQTMYIKKSATP